jgi:3'(2'), 5'-bisphosphate nucleotidase
MVNSISNIPIDSVIAVAQSAGHLIEDFYNKRNYGVHRKADNSPVTDADLAAHRHICAQLSAQFPWPIISEENDDFTLSRETSTYWLVDPIDGTHEFLEHTGQFTVNIALIHERRSVLGIIYAPIFRQLYYASQVSGAKMQQGEQAATPLQCRPLDPQHLGIMASKRFSKAAYAKMQELWPNCDIMTIGSSLKFCRIAEGCADLYVRRGRTGEWDTAAAQCIVEQAGGVILDKHGNSLLYGKKDFCNEEFIACGDAEYGRYVARVFS